mmetsp:Transcript_126069/g.356473  ORF Transcript_126069/g.356473 Transcript_126069/m.356473 type:complete len:263 (-) Transcript_126069:1860-2648(-)
MLIPAHRRRDGVVRDREAQVGDLHRRVPLALLLLLRADVLDPPGLGALVQRLGVGAGRLELDRLEVGVAGLLEELVAALHGRRAEARPGAPGGPLQRDGRLRVLVAPLEVPYLREAHGPAHQHPAPRVDVVGGLVALGEVPRVARHGQEEVALPEVRVRDPVPGHPLLVRRAALPRGRPLRRGSPLLVGLAVALHLGAHQLAGLAPLLLRRLPLLLLLLLVRGALHVVEVEHAAAAVVVVLVLVLLHPRALLRGRPRHARPA